MNALGNCLAGVIVFVLVTAGSQPVALGQIVKSVEAVGMTVSDMDRSVQFFSKVLSFQKVSDVEVWGTQYERLQGRSVCV